MDKTPSDWNKLTIGDSDKPCATCASLVLDAFDSLDSWLAAVGKHLKAKHGISIDE